MQYARSSLQLKYWFTKFRPHTLATLKKITQIFLIGERK